MRKIAAFERLSDETRRNNPNVFSIRKYLVALDGMMHEAVRQRATSPVGFAFLAVALERHMWTHGDRNPSEQVKRENPRLFDDMDAQMDMRVPAAMQLALHMVQRVNDPDLNHIAAGIRADDAELPGIMKAWGIDWPAVAA